MAGEMLRRQVLGGGQAGGGGWWGWPWAPNGPWPSLSNDASQWEQLFTNQGGPQPMAGPQALFDDARRLGVLTDQGWKRVGQVPGEPPKDSVVPPDRQPNPLPNPRDSIGGNQGPIGRWVEPPLTEAPPIGQIGVNAQGIGQILRGFADGLMLARQQAAENLRATLGGAPPATTAVPTPPSLNIPSPRRRQGGWQGDYY